MSQSRLIQEEAGLLRWSGRFGEMVLRGGLRPTGRPGVGALLAGSAVGTFCRSAVGAFWEIGGGDTAATGL